MKTPQHNHRTLEILTNEFKEVTDDSMKSDILRKNGQGSIYTIIASNKEGKPSNGHIIAVDRDVNINDEMGDEQYNHQFIANIDDAQQRVKHTFIHTITLIKKGEGKIWTFEKEDTPGANICRNINEICNSEDVCRSARRVVKNSVSKKNS
jgi:hypothetical protein